MKRLTLIISLLMVAILAFSACGKKDIDQSQNGDTTIGSEDGDKKDEDKTSPDDTRVSKIFTDLMSSKNYTMKYKAVIDMGDGNEVEMTSTMAVKGDQQAFITEMQGQESQTLLKDNKIYIIDHANKTVVIMGGVADGSGDTSILSPGDVDFSAPVYSDSGSEDFFGTVRDYEEYKSEGSSIRYYLDGKELVGMSFISSEGTMKWVIEELSDKVDDKMFEIPADYEKFDMGN